jgi:hypothetical protein
MKGDNYVGAAEPQLREKISQLYSAVAGFAGKPTNAQLDNMKLLEGKLREAEKTLNEMINQLPEINKALEANGLAPIKVRAREEFMKA